nr:MAG TPA: hypothetical protein [Caudoviricetes sp.]
MTAFSKAIFFSFLRPLYPRVGCLLLKSKLMFGIIAS